LYNFILKEGKYDDDGNQFIEAKVLGAFYKAHPSAEAAIKKRVKTFLSPYKTLFEWKDGPEEVGYGFIYCVSLGNFSALKPISNPLTNIESSSTVVLVYHSRNVDGKNRVRRFLLTLCRATIENTFSGKSTVVMCQAAWPMLRSTILDLKVSCKSTADAFTIIATGAPDDANKFMCSVKQRIHSIQSIVIPISEQKRKLGLLKGLLRAYLDSENTAANIDDDVSTVCSEINRKNIVGYSSFYIDVVGKGIGAFAKQVTVSFLSPEATENIDIEREIETFQLLVRTISDVVDSYGERFCTSSSIRRGLDPIKTITEYSLYDVCFIRPSKMWLLCGEIDAVNEACRWLTEVPTNEREESQVFKALNSRVSWLLKRKQHSSVVESIKGAVRNATSIGGTGRVIVSDLVKGRAYAETALFIVQGPHVMVQQGISEGLRVQAAWLSTFSDKYLFETEDGQCGLTSNQKAYLQNEGSNLLKKTGFEFGVCIKNVASDSSKNGNAHNFPRTTLLQACFDSVHIIVAKENLLRVHCQAIVNPANGSLRHGAGAARAISDAAGPALNSECATILLRYPQNKIPITESVVTDSYEIKTTNPHINYVVHSVGPVYSSTGSQMEEMYLQTVMNALKAAVDIGAVSIAIPLMGSGIYRWPPDLAANLLVGAISKWIGSGGVCKKIVLTDLDDSKIAELINAVQSSNDGIIPYLENLSRPPPVAVPIRVPQFAWYWEVLSHEKDVTKQDSLYNRPNVMKSSDGRRWIPYDYDQVSQIEASTTFPVILRGDIGGVTNNASYALTHGDRQGEFKQVNQKTGFSRTVIRKPFQSTMSMHGYEPIQPAVAVVVNNNENQVTEKYSRISKVKTAADDVVSKEGVHIYGPKNLVESAENAIKKALLNEAKVSDKPFHLPSEPEDWESVLQRLRSVLLLSILLLLI
jgi:O-acetyl-ADP-ribose deacetylase (regulator of RNase III)